MKRALVLDVLLGLLAAAVVTAAAWRAQQDGSAIPFSDEAAHLQLLHGFAARFAAQRSPLHQLGTALFDSDAYPNGLYLATLPWLNPPTLTTARLGLLPFFAMPAFLGVAVGSRAWGRIGGLAYAALIGLTPVALAFARIYFIDVALYGVIAAAVPLLAASEGFRRPGPSIGFALLAVYGLYIKWTWLVLLGPATLVVALGAAWAAPGWRARAGWAVGGLVLAAAVAWTILTLGRSASVTDWSSQGEDWVLPVRVFLAGLGVCALWAVVATRRTLPPALQACLVALVIALCAGPWYVLLQSQLFGRLTHETNMFAVRNGEAPWQASQAFVRLLLPVGELFLPGAVLAAAIVRRGGWMIAALGLGAGVGYFATVSALPFDTRYLLPLAPLGAGIVVSAWRGLPVWVTAPALLLVLVLVGQQDLRALQGGAPASKGAYNGLGIDQVYLFGRPLARLTGPTREGGDPRAVDALIDALRTDCAEGCTVSMRSSPVYAFAPRSLATVLAFADAPVHVEEGNGAVDKRIYVDCSALPGGGPRPPNVTWVSPEPLAPGCFLVWVDQ